jgi:hypothetical protein
VDKCYSKLCKKNKKRFLLICYCKVVLSNKKQKFRGCVKQVESIFVDVNRQAIKSSSLEALVQIS